MDYLPLPAPLWKSLSASHRFSPWRGIGLCLALLLPLLATAAPDPLDTQRQLFVSAEAALKLGDRDLYPALRRALTDYPLYPYLIYRELSDQLDQAPAAEVRAFLDSYADTPLAVRLRRAWLKRLAREQRWGDYLRDYRDMNDTSLECWRRQGLLAQGDVRAALKGIEALWLHGRSQPDACDPLFARWREQGGITQQRVWRRFALAMEAGEHGLARYLARLLPATDQPLATLWLEVDKQPSLVLVAERFETAGARGAEILLHGLKRWSRRDSVAAAAALDRVKARQTLPRDGLLDLERRLAVYVASRGDPSAAARLAALPDSAVDETVREWRVRVALRQRDWAQTLHWLDRLTPKQQQAAQWRYWRARALEAGGQVQEAKTLYRKVAGQRSYYGFLAADRVRVPYRLNDEPLQVGTGELSALKRHPGIRRARELFLLKRYWEARVEWQRVMRTLDNKGLRQAAKLAQHWNWHDRSIVIAARLGHWDDLNLRFPLPYRTPVLDSANRDGVDPAWIYAIMRQESIFQPDARSRAGALGLMQLMPATGRQVARELNTPLGRGGALYLPETNIRFGAYYLRSMLNDLQSNPLLATAAYNAGPNRVRSWLPDQGSIDADLWAETIPFAETRRYVQRVLEYAMVYDLRLNGVGRIRPGAMSARMPTIQSIPGES